jgi:hypothetical protein
MAIPDKAITRGEQYLAAMAGQSGTLPDEPITRKEFYLAKAAGQAVETPEPITREEMYLDAIAEGGGGGGDITLTTLNVSANGTTNAPSGTAYNKVVANVSNSYAAADEGKVVQNGELVAQTAHAEVTSNGTVDTTTNNSVTVNVPEKTLTTKSISSNGTYAASGDNADGYSSVTVNVSASGLQWTLIGQSTHNLPEYTDTTAAEATTDTGINVQNTNFCWLLVVVICDTPIETSTEWGMTVAMLGTTTTGLIYAPSALNTYWEKGSATLSRSALATTVQYNGNNIGLFFQPSNNSATVKFSRKANSGYCPKLRAGNYTVKVYGLSSL